MTIRSTRAPIDQLGFVTASLDHAVQGWMQRFGVGPWTVYRNVRLEGEYRGQPTTVTINVALGYRGEEQIEFIEVTSQSPSPYQDESGKPLEGLHHIAWIVDDLDTAAKDLEGQDLVPVFRAQNPAVRVIYFSDPAQPGVLFELIHGETSRADHAAGVALAKNWDGSNPITEIDLGNL